MDKESVERLRFDRRLKRRSGWIEETDHQVYLDALPDVSEKMTTCANEETGTGEAAAESTSAPAPVAGDFSTPSAFGGAGGDFDRN
jgi:hypothetical protein